MTAEQLLAQLEGIDVSISASWWPLAIGWWLLILLFLFALLAIRLGFQKKQSALMFNAASLELDQIKRKFDATGDLRSLLADLSVWLKKVSLYTYPRQNTAAMTGDQWLRFLDEKSGQKKFTDGPGQVFGTSLYRADVDQSVDGAVLLETCANWLASIKPDIIQRGKQQ